MTLRVKKTKNEMVLVQATNICRTYDTAGGNKLEVLKDANLTVNRGEVIAIVGESGAGKSTLLHILGALERPTVGEVVFDGKQIFDLPNEALANFRNNKIGFIFQFHHLLPEFSAIENVAMPALIQNKPFKQVQKRAAELLESLNLKDRMHHRPAELSGGEQQRVAVARALMNNPSLVLADEPTGNLDPATAEKLHNEIVSLSRREKQTFIIATHNMALAQLADRVLIMKDGDLIEKAT